MVPLIIEGVSIKGISEMDQTKEYIKIKWNKLFLKL